MSGGITETPAVGIGKMLMDSRFIVPNHQRDYSWRVEEIEQLFDDIEDAILKESGIYFLGLMVFLRSRPNILTVLDGQQRLATVVIVLSAIRAWLQQYSDHADDAAKIQEWFIGRSELGEKELQARLTLNAANSQTFSEYILKSVALEDIEEVKNRLKRQDPNRRLLEAAVYAHERVRKMANSHGSPAEAAKYLFKFVLYIRDQTHAVRLIVESEDAAFTIFETLNDRGLDLSPLDLIKNHLFRSADAKSETQVRDLESRWAQMMATLANVSSDNFLKVYWTSRHGRIRTTNLFNAFKRQYATPQSAIDLSLDMLGASEHYAALDAADDPVWARYPEAVRTVLRSQGAIGGQLMHPIMLAALSKLAVSEMERLLRLLEVVIVRYQLIGGGNTGKLESSASIIARKIFAGELTSATAVFQDFRDIYPSDEEFRQNFLIKQERNNARAQYYLRKIEAEAIRLDRGIMAQELQPGSLTVEHILPKNPADEWKDVIVKDPDTVEESVFRIGNLCLLTQVNKDLGRKSFSDKRKVFGESSLLTTRMVADVDLWDRSAIERRQEHLAKLAVSAWRFQ
ncbi:MULTISPECIES: DUF262 domain-containing protein [unclassified Inquilinus]|uniref:DUF262 domain-containing protein n=1 Tax=unclassified Inquilinus TaxID=2645927 RepID=UPI003F8F3770